MHVKASVDAHEKSKDDSLDFCSLEKIIKNMQLWRNGRRAGLRSQWATVWVQVPLAADTKTGQILISDFDLFLLFGQSSVFEVEFLVFREKERKNK